MHRAPQAPSRLRTVLSWLLLPVISLLVAGVIYTFVLALPRVIGPSMRSTLLEGERMVVSRLTYRMRDPVVGEIAYCAYPDDERQMVKRIIALGGDRLRIEQGEVYRNDTALIEPYVDQLDDFSMQEITIPDGHCFVMGDNRANSKDSRQVGPLPLSYLKGRCEAVFWPVASVRSLLP